jgi:hypothetical protein
MNKELKKNNNEYWSKKRTPDNPRYMLWMLYRGILEPPDEQYEYINWLHARIKDFNAQKEKGIKDINKYLMWYVRNHLIANCSISETF